jgi:hypothetical protein
MAKNGKKNRPLGEVQVFELTMDNDEDQDELNQQLRKPGEQSPAKPVEAAPKDFKRDNKSERLGRKDT